MRTSTDAARRSADAAIQSANVAERTLITTQRAWIKVDANIAAPLTFHELGASTTVAFKIRNVGNSPAIHVTPHVWLGVLKEGGPSPQDEQKRRRDELRQGSFPFGFTLFPGESFPEPKVLVLLVGGVVLVKRKSTKGVLLLMTRSTLLYLLWGAWITHFHPILNTIIKPGLFTTFLR